MAFSLNQASFTGGELAPSLHARTDLGKYATGLAECRNCFIHAHGGVSNRPGTQFVNEARYHDKKCRLIDFEFSTIQTYMLEFGHQCLRVVKDGGQVVYPAGHASEGQVVEIATPFAEEELMDLGYVQSADVMTIVHRSHPPMELRRTDHHEWELVEISWQPSISAPANVTSSSGTGTKYVVTSVANESLEESLPSAEVEGASGTKITFNSVAEASKYNVYKQKNGIFGYIGSTEITEFTDSNIAPLLDDTPPKSRNPFVGAGNYPGATTYYQQRLVFGGSINKPQTVWTTQSGNYTNLNVASPTKADDAITFGIPARSSNEIRHLVPQKSLIALTSSGEWSIQGGDDGVLTPTNPNPESHGERGSARVAPLVIGRTILYVQSRGAIVRDLAFTIQDDGYAGDDLSVLANHMFEGRQIVDWCYAQAPSSIVWCVRDDGVLLGLTYMREHEIWGWHQHTTDGFVESICSIPEGDEDAVYMAVRREVNGQTKRYIERIHTRKFSAVEEAFFVDCGLTYSGNPAQTISGLDHLEGKGVAILADGNVVAGKTVSGGAVTLDQPASKIHIGLPYTSHIKLLRPDFNTKEYGSTVGKRKTLNASHIHYLNSRGGWVGTNENNMEQLLQREFEGWGVATELQTGIKRQDIGPDWDDDGQLIIEQRDPLPMTVLSATPELTIAD